MGTTIKDGGGRGYEARVSSDFRLLSHTITETEEVYANKLGNAYNINTGIITLSDDAETPICYINNSGETKELVVVGLVFGFGPSIGGTSTDMMKITTVRNPTGGTIVSNATAVDILGNRNYGSSNIADILAYKGATGNTLTGGDDYLLVFAGTRSRSFIDINAIIPKGSSMGIKVQSQSNNTSQEVYVAVVCYLHEDA